MLAQVSEPKLEVTLHGHPYKHPELPHQYYVHEANSLEKDYMTWLMACSMTNKLISNNYLFLCNSETVGLFLYYLWCIQRKIINNNKERICFPVTWDVSYISGRLILKGCFISLGSQYCLWVSHLDLRIHEDYTAALLIIPLLVSLQ